MPINLKSFEDKDRLYSLESIENDEARRFFEEFLKGKAECFDVPWELQAIGDKKLICMTWLSDPNLLFVDGRMYAYRGGVLDFDMVKKAGFEVVDVGTLEVLADICFRGDTAEAAFYLMQLGHRLNDAMPRKRGNMIAPPPRLHEDLEIIQAKVNGQLTKLPETPEA